MVIPKKIHFAGQNYKVSEVSNLTSDDGVWGRTDFYNCLIDIDKDLAVGFKEETLIHELMHIAYWHTSNKLTKEGEEDIIKPWSLNIYGILKDNNLLK